MCGPPIECIDGSGACISTYKQLVAMLEHAYECVAAREEEATAAVSDVVQVEPPSTALK